MKRTIKIIMTLLIILLLIMLIKVLLQPKAVYEPVFEIGQIETEPIVEIDLSARTYSFMSEEPKTVSRGNYERSDTELELLARVIYAEASNKKDICTEDRYAVGTVVMNRVESNRFPNTIKEVVYQQGQYACTFNGGSRLFNSDIPNEVMEVAKDILYNNVRTLPSNVIWQAGFKQGKVYKQIGVHYYCY